MLIGTVVFLIKEFTFGVSDFYSKKTLSLEDHETQNYCCTHNLSCPNFAHDVGFYRKINLEAPERIN